MSQEYRIMFVCTGNTCRSYMAEVIAQNHLALRHPAANIYVSSAGTGCLGEEPATLQAQAVMAEMGYPARNHRARRLTCAMVNEANLIFTMTDRQRMDILRLVPEARDKVFLLKEYTQVAEERTGLSDLDIIDPFGEDIEFYRACAREIGPLVTRVLDGILRV